MSHPAPAPSRRRRLFTSALLLVAMAAAAQSVVASPAAANPPMPGDPIGSLEHVVAGPDGTTHLQGWAADPDTTANVSVLGLVDGRIVASTVTSLARPTLARRQHTGPTPGFDLSMTVPATGVHVVCAAVSNVGPGISQVIGCGVTPVGARLSAADVAARSPQGAVTSAAASSSTVTVSGWGTDPDFRRGRVVAVLYLDGQSAQTVTTRVAPDSARAAGSGPFGAFAFSVPVSTGAHLACVWLVNVGFGSNTSLGCTALDTRGPAGLGPVTQPALNKKVVQEALRHIGQSYVWGAVGPKTFDCSGLVMYSYGKSGFTTPRIAQDQFAAARVIPAARAVPGDLVFYHDGVGAVYHVGIYLAPLDTVAAIDESEGVAHQHIWDPTSATYGSFTHT